MRAKTHPSHGRALHEPPDELYGITPLEGPDPLDRADWLFRDLLAWKSRTKVAVYHYDTTTTVGSLRKRNQRLREEEKRARGDSD